LAPEIQEAAPSFLALDQTFPGVDPRVIVQAAMALTRALSRLQISMAEERLRKVLFTLIRKAHMTGEKPTEELAIQEILNP
jgi:ABC-type lipopolysaccharide export system ATPase subunit